MVGQFYLLLNLTHLDISRLQEYKAMTLLVKTKFEVSLPMLLYSLKWNA